jgi:hypothetical protein
MIKVIALAIDEGWAFIKTDERTYLLKPPYEDTNCNDISPEITEKAISSYGFEGCDIDFNSLSDVVSFLKGRYIESKKRQTGQLPSEKDILRLLDFIDESIILEYLERAEQELISKGRFDEAEALILKLKENVNLNTNNNLKDTIDRLYIICDSEKKKFREIVEEKKRIWPSKFPHLCYPFEHVIEFQRRASIERQIFPIAMGG